MAQIGKPLELVRVIAFCDEGRWSHPVAPLSEYEANLRRRGPGSAAKPQQPRLTLDLMTPSARAQKEAHEAKLARDAVNATQRLPNAVRRGDVAAVEVLLKKGADWGTVVSTSGSLVKLAEDNGRQNVAQLLREKQIS